MRVGAPLLLGPLLNRSLMLVTGGAPELEPALLVPLVALNRGLLLMPLPAPALLLLLLAVLPGGGVMLLVVGGAAAAAGGEAGGGLL